MQNRPDILSEIQNCARAARNNKVYLTQTFVVENWPLETLEAAGDEIRKLREHVALLKSRLSEIDPKLARTPDYQPQRIESISERVNRMGGPR